MRVAGSRLERLYVANLWHRMNTWPALPRRAFKTAIFLVVLLAVLFPNPRRLVRHVGRLGRLDQLIQPDVGRLDELQRRLDPLWAAAETPQDKLDAVQKFVEEQVPYDWDWDTWLVVDYVPTVEEVLSKGREDCDGRAVLAASLLRGRGYNAKLVGNFLHMWVWTEHGETMHPAGQKALESTPEGVRVHWQAFADAPRHLAFGIAVFPLLRELIVVAALWILLLPPYPRWRWALAGGALMLVALAVWRVTARDPWAISRLGCWIGLIIAVAAIQVCLLAPQRGQQAAQS